MLGPRPPSSDADTHQSRNWCDMGQFGLRIEAVQELRAEPDGLLQAVPDFFLCDRGEGSGRCRWPPLLCRPADRDKTQDGSARVIAWDAGFPSERWGPVSRKATAQPNSGSCRSLRSETTKALQTVYDLLTRNI